MPNLNFATAGVTENTKLIGFDFPVPDGERTYTARTVADFGSLASEGTAGRVPGIGGTSLGNAANVAQLNTKVTNGGGASSVRVLTQAAYDALIPNSSTVYIIVG